MTTEVAFHTGLQDKLGYACRLLRKAYRQGLRVVVHGSPQELQQLDQALWTFEPQEFVPHARLSAGREPAAALQRTPIWLVEAGTAPPHHGVLVNLGPTRFPGAGSFERVVELVGAEPEDALAGRRRWKQYEGAGWTIDHRPQAEGG